eukprot:3523067-Rhodomonas_salina.4
MSGTQTAYAATRLNPFVDDHSVVQIQGLLPSYATPTQCPVLTYSTVQYAVLPWAMSLHSCCPVLNSTDMGCVPTHTLRDFPY